MIISTVKGLKIKLTTRLILIVKEWLLLLFYVQGRFINRCSLTWL